MVVLIPIGGKKYHVIGLVEVVWKAVAVIFNRRFTAFITYHNSLHGLREGCGTDTTTIEVKLIHQLMAMREEVLHTIFLDLHKAYNTLNRSRCLDILEGYEVGPRSLRRLCRYWGRLHMVARKGRVLQRILPRGERRDAGVPAVDHHL